MPANIQGILFDFGGTLAKQQAPLVIQRILSDEGTHCPLDTLEGALVAAWEEDALTASRSEFRGYTRIGEENEYVRFNRLILSHAGIKRDEDKLARIINKKWAEYASTVERKPFEDVAPCLEKLREANLRMGVVSNIDSKEELQRGLLDLKIANYFGVMVASGEVGYEKPRPEIFRIASQELKLSPANLVHVGDLYAVDVIGAKAAGMTGILIDRDSKLPNIECRRIRSLEELPAIVGELRV